MMGRVLCSVGAHDWDVHKQDELQIDLVYAVRLQLRCCLRCWKRVWHAWVVESPEGPGYEDA